MKILLIEDDDIKRRDITAVVQKTLLNVPHELLVAINVIEAEDRIRLGKYNLLILDISMNISGGSRGPTRGGYANLGGLDIAEGMWLKGVSIPTIVVTAFDYFQRGGAKAGPSEMVSLEGVEARAREYCGDNLIDCIRYGDASWDEKLKQAVLRAGAL